MSQAVTEARSAALDRVLALLEVEGGNARLIKRVRIEAKRDGLGPPADRHWHPPRAGPGNQPLADRIEAVSVNKPPRCARLVAQNKKYQRDRVSEAL